MLKVLAIQVLEGCKEHIMRCLKPNLMYYLCHDYVISQSTDDKWYVKKHDLYIDNIDEKFYRIKRNSKVCINISAIVGENGSGKSTIVELMLRMINNCAIKFGIRTEDGKLEYVEGVCARLFYLNSDKICCLSIKGGLESISVSEIATLAKGAIKPTMKSLTEEDLKGDFFYTLVSNYSHYAYNTNDFRKEWNDNTNEDTCWLKWIFHKNDGYQTPVTLHPFRDQGTINMEREKTLSNQRLLYFFINYVKNKDEHGVFDYINGKSPKYLNLREVMISKLQKVTLLNYLRNCRDVNLLEEEIQYLDDLKASKKQMTKDQLEEFKRRIILPLKEITERVIGNGKGRKPLHLHYFHTLLDWIEQQNSDIIDADAKILSNNSDLKKLLEEIDDLRIRLNYDLAMYSEVSGLYNNLSSFARLNICQIQRLEILDDVCDFWRDIGRLDKIAEGYRFNMTPKCITEDYRNLSLEQQCYHYIVYKTIDIFETYPSYRYPLWAYQKTAVHFGRKEGNNDAKKLLRVAFRQLLDDVMLEKTHITLKMRQAFYYLNHAVKDGKDCFYSARETIEGIEGICLSSEKLRNLFKGINEQNLETLPPPIYERHLLFETLNGDLVDMDTFSSGEKQLLNTQSVIVYHLQNLYSIFNDPVRIKYPGVNIILEEIELYFHPEYQRSFIYSLINLLEHSSIDDKIKDVNILIVTHSPFILSDIPKSNVLFLKDGEPVTDMQENTFGANIHSMLTNGFFLPSLPVGEFAHDKINRMFESFNSVKIDRESYIERNRLYSDIARVGEPYLREQLMRLFNMYYPPCYHD